MSSVDLLPTILDVAGEPSPPGVEGRSLRPRDPAPRAALRSLGYVK